MANSNTKKVSINIPNDLILKRIKSTPTLNRLSKLDLVVGENIETVNHYQLSALLRMFPLLGCEIKEIK